MDADSLRHTTLQNRAAIDFLLLARSHGCQDFEGMCCMSLSDHSKPIHAHLADLRALGNQLHIDDNWNPFGNLHWGWPWLQNTSPLWFITFVNLWLYYVLYTNYHVCNKH